MPGPAAQLRRVVGLLGAVALGLGSILGTGVFVSLLFVNDLARPASPWCIAAGALLATCNGLSSAQLAAAHPLSGGSYEYGYRYLNPTLGFTAGWMFLAAKSASAATAALGFAVYLQQFLPAAAGIDTRIIAVLTIVVLTALVLAGLKRSVRVNTVLVLISLTGLAIVCFVALAEYSASDSSGLARSLGGSAKPSNLLQATALCFVAYTGYGRVATMGEEIRNPTRNIPIAVIATLAVTLTVYIAVGFAILTLRPSGSMMPGLTHSTATATLTQLVEPTTLGHLAPLVTVGAATAMLGVLLNLILGLSRVALAMARRSDLPHPLAHLTESDASPRNAILFIAAIILSLSLIGDVKTTWSLSAFTVLIYYATANLCALRQPSEERRFPRAVSLLGLIACLSLSAFVAPSAWQTGLTLIALGLLWHKFARRVSQP
ncbi:MAG: APC family permease [Planctomycetota bacterium]|jgi:APA family basic amino acid/polyamine antiporter